MRIGIDVGGTKIEGIALDGRGRTLGRRRVETPRGDYDATVGAVVDLVAGLEGGTGRRGTVGIGIPGTVSPASGLIKNANSVWLNGRPFHSDLARALARPVRLANDANCFALSEATDGAGAGEEVVFGVILGTGTGGGIVVRGHILTGPNGVAGEWGHNPLPWPDADDQPARPCYCGRSGCIETYLSGPGLAADYRRATGDDVPGHAVAERAAAGDHAAAACVARHEVRLAKALAGVINVLDPGVIVLGGGLSGMAHLYTGVPRRWGSWVFSDRVDTRIAPPRHGDASGVRGAAWLWELREDAAVTTT